MNARGGFVPCCRVSVLLLFCSPSHIWSPLKILGIAAVPAGLRHFRRRMISDHDQPIGPSHGGPVVDHERAALCYPPAADVYLILNHNATPPFDFRRVQPGSPADAIESLPSKQPCRSRGSCRERFSRHRRGERFGTSAGEAGSRGSDASRIGGRRRRRLRLSGLQLDLCPLNTNASGRRSMIIQSDLARAPSRCSADRGLEHRHLTQMSRLENASRALTSR